MDSQGGTGAGQQGPEVQTGKAMQGWQEAAGKLRTPRQGKDLLSLHPPPGFEEGSIPEPSSLEGL